MSKAKSIELEELNDTINYLLKRKALNMSILKMI